MRLLLIENYDWIKRSQHITLDELIFFSKCNIGVLEVEFMRTIFKNFRVLLLFRGSRDGWEHEDFHSRCDMKGPTITLFQIKNGDCIGGFTQSNWHSSSIVKKKENNSLIFNATSQKYFPCIDNRFDISSAKKSGPYFGGFECELGALYSPYNGDKCCRSWANCRGYKIPLENNLNSLTNMTEGRFTISEIEVWHAINLNT